MQRTIPRESQIGWLAGIIDGEGTIGCYFYHDRGIQSPRYGIWIVNTDQRIINQCVMLFQKFGIQAPTGEKHYKVGGLGKKRCWYLQVTRKNDVKIILEAITPYLVSKHDQAQLILNFFQSYPNLLKGRGNRSGKKNEHFRVYNQLIKDLKSAKQRIGEPVETKR